MDLVAACRMFVHVGERGSFTLGAAAVMAQVARSLHDLLRTRELFHPGLAIPGTSEVFTVSA